MKIKIKNKQRNKLNFKIFKKNYAIYKFFLNFGTK